MSIARVLALAQKAHVRSEMEIFLSDLLGCSRLDLLARSGDEVPVQHLAALQKGWIRLQDGVPVAYLTHKKEFYGRLFCVNEDVLIPRPETEKLVELTLKYARKGVLELGTGSGAIACSVKVNQPELEVWATDISSEALKVANKNCVQLGVEVTLLKSDLLAEVPPALADVLVANLPYIGKVTHADVDENVRKHEPSVALFGGDNGLRLYERLFEQIREQNRDFQFILGEIGFTQGADLERLLKEKLSDYKFTLLQDFQGLDRTFVLERN